LHVLLAAGAGAQDQDVERIEVRVTAVSGEAVYLDQGREARIEVGDTVELRPPGRPLLVGRIEALSRTSSRAGFVDPPSSVRVGQRGEVLVPLARLRPAEEPQAPVESVEPVEPEEPPGEAEPPVVQEGPPRPDAPEHPEWEHPPEEWDEDVPLLAPAHVRPREERPRRTTGRLYTRFSVTRDDSFEEQRFTSSITGVDLETENPFGRGGVFDLRTEYSWRNSDTDGGQDETERRARLDRASYRWGGVRGQPQAWRVGRFLHGEFPELGLVDGAELVHRFEGGSRMGVSLGLLPEPSDEQASGEDLEASVFYRYVADEKESLALGAALQKTWHEGSADRDLLITTLDAFPTSLTSVHASAWLDYYTSGDDLKSSGFELTQLDVSGTLRTEGGHGLSAFVRHQKWPDVERDEFQSVSAGKISDGYVTRYGVNGWAQTSEHTRLSVRADQWEDDEDSGGSGNLRLALRDVLFDRGEVTLETFGSTGSFNDVLGVRVGATKTIDRGRLGLSWHAAEYEQEDFVGGQSEILQHTVRGSCDLLFGQKWDVSIYVDDRFGDDQDSQSVGFYLQRRL
jgi:hypothetical protein